MAKGSKPQKRGGSGKRRNGTTPQQDAFAREYVLNGNNGAAAYAKAYPKSAHRGTTKCSEEARKLLKKTAIRAAVAEYTEMMAEAAKELAEKGGDPDTAMLTDLDRERVTFRISADRVLEELATIAFADPRRLYRWGTKSIPVLNKKTGEPILNKDGEQVTYDQPFMEVTPSDHLTDDDVRTVAGVEMEISKTGDMVLKIKRADKMKALGLLGTHLKLFTNKIEHTGKVESGPVHLMVTPSEEGV